MDEMTVIEDTDTQFSTRDVPWLKLGTIIDDTSVTAERAMELAGLGWHVDLRRDGYQTAGGTWRIDPSRRKVVRVDTEEPLGTVSPTYEILQYDEAFEFMDEIHPEYVAAGSLRGGRQAFIVTRAPSFEHMATLDGEDPHDLYVVLRASHDGSRAVEVNLLPLRGACMNMMPVGGFGRSNDGYNAQAHQRWSIRHTKNLREKLTQARDVLTGLDTYTRAYNETAERLAAIQVSLDEARHVIEDVTPTHLAQPERQVEAIMDVYEHSTHNGYVGTGWGVLNAVTEFHDHHRGGENRLPETRWVQGLDGTTTRAVNRTVARLLTRS